MAKKSKKATNKEKSIDDKLNLAMRLLHGSAVNTMGSHCVNSFSESLVMGVISEIKNIYYTMDKKEVEGLVYEGYFMELLNIVEEILFLIYSGNENISEEVQYFKKKIIDMYKAEDLKYELYIYLNKVCFLLENPLLYGETTKGRIYGNVAKIITDILFCFFLYATTFVLKHKNKKMNCFIEKDGHIEIKYENGQLLPNEIVESLYESMKTNSTLTDKQHKSFQIVFESMHRIYSNYLGRFIDDEFYEEDKGYLDVKKEYTFPIINTEREISIEKLSQIPFNRKYAFSSSGIRFEFTNKKESIDHIDIVEKPDMFNINVFVINSGGINVVKNYVNIDDEWGARKELLKNRKDINSEEKVNSKIIRLPLYINKEKLKNAKDFDSIIKSFCILGYRPKPSQNTDKFYADIFRVVLNCLYSALYDLHIFKNTFTMYNKVASNKGGYQRNSGFRVAHIRKLPKGQKISAESIQNAKKEGFVDIPEGYTFVKASITNETDKKVVKIK